MHEGAASFGKVAAEYERGRPGYPYAVVEWVIERGGLGSSSVIVDLAAGTGKLTRELVRSGAHIIAVEPLSEMRAQLEMAVPGVEVLEGTAESMPLSSGSADAVTVAAAFHWFSTNEALAEIWRVLRPGGKLFLVWNKRDQSDPLQVEITGIIEEEWHRDHSPPPRQEKWRGVMEASSLFRLDGEFAIPSYQDVDSDGMADRFGSVSFVASLPGDERQRVEERLRALVPPGGQVRLVYSTEVSAWTRS